jgi:type I restriction enzyme S subunit
VKDHVSIEDIVTNSRWATTIGQVCDEFGGEVQTGPFGSQLHASDYSESGTPVVMPQDMYEGRIVCDRIVRVGPQHVSKLKRHVLQTGDIVYSRRGDVTRFAVVTDLEAGWLCGTGSIRIRLNCPQIEIGYVRRYLQQEAVGKWLKHYAKGVTMPNLNTELVRALPFIYPPLAEQRRIAEVLDRAEALRAKRRAALAQLDSLTQSLFLDLFGDPVTNPKGWPKETLGEVTEMVTGYPFRSEEYVKKGDSVRLCRGANILPGRLDWSDLARWPESKTVGLAEFKLEAGDVVIAMDRPWISEGFKIARVQPEDCPALLVQRVARLRGGKELPNEFLFHLLNQSAFTRHCRPTETTIPHISPKDIRSFAFPNPPIELQREFARRITAVETLKTAHRASLAELDALFATLQHRAFRGEL